MTSQLNSLSNMVKNMNAQNVCDAKCQERKKTEELRKTYVKAKQNAQNAQPNLDRAEKNYFTAARGAAFYSKLQGAKFKKQAQKQVKDWNDYQNHLGQLDTLNYIEQELSDLLKKQEQND